MWNLSVTVILRKHSGGVLVSESYGQSDSKAGKPIRTDKSSVHPLAEVSVVHGANGLQSRSSIVIESSPSVSAIGRFADVMEAVMNS
jgi:hypothetical protein